MTKWALITGGAHPMGIGMASARNLRAQGYQCVVTGLTESECALTPKEDGIVSRVLDVTDESSIADLMAGFDRLDVLVNCAGMGMMDEFDLANFQTVVDVNMTGTFRMCKAAYPLLRKQGGAIVNTASMYAIFGAQPGVYYSPAYSASKSGVMGMTRTLAVAWAREGIRVNAVAPGWIKTNINPMLWENGEFNQWLENRTPMGRWGEGQELGDVIGFLCSPAARFVTGVMIPVDGGYAISG